MKVTCSRLPKNTVELLVECSVAEVQPHLNRAAERLSATRPVPGFRPGKAPYAVAEKQFGADVLWHEAAETIAKETFPKAIAEQKLTTVGAPEISIQKLAPGNPFIYKATVALLPDVSLGDYRGLQVKKRAVHVNDDDVTKLLEELRRSRGTEALVSRSAQMGDKVEIDFQGFLDGIPVDGATSKTHPLVLGSKQFVPGFEEQLVNMKANEKKEFTIRFPKEYHERRLANRDILFRVTMRSVYQVTLPMIDDAFAKSVGDFKALTDLKERLRKNLESSKREEERERYERAMIDAIIEISTFGEMPDRLVESETAKMLDELHHHIEERGMEYPKYLESIKKTEEELKKEFLPRAERRLKSALVMRSIAKKEHIDVHDDAVKKEIEQTKRLYAGNETVERNLATPEYFSYLKNALTTKRVVEFLDDLIGSEEEKT